MKVFQGHPLFAHVIKSYFYFNKVNNPQNEQCDQSSQGYYRDVNNNVAHIDLPTNNPDITVVDITKTLWFISDSDFINKTISYDLILSENAIIFKTHNGQTYKLTPVNGYKCYNVCGYFRVQEGLIKYVSLDKETYELLSFHILMNGKYDHLLRQETDISL